MTLDLRGHRFGRLTAEAAVVGSRRGRRKWVCVCDCGTRVTVRTCELRNGNTRSCGCLSSELTKRRFVTHGVCTNSRAGLPSEYRTWVSMRYRCSNSNCKRWHDYGGRGISVCDRWLNGDGHLTGFECFFSDMGPKPSPSHSIDRIDNEGNYEPSNCRWATTVEQRHNRRDSALTLSLQP